MWLVACIVAALVMLALIPFVLAGILLALAGMAEGGVRFLAWLFSPLERLINAYNRLTHCIGYRIGRAIRSLMNKVTNNARK